MKQAIVLLLVATLASATNLKSLLGVSHIVQTVDKEYEKFFNKEFLTGAAPFYAKNAKFSFTFPNGKTVKLVGQKAIRDFLEKERERGIKDIQIHNTKSNLLTGGLIRTEAELFLNGLSGLEKGTQIQILQQNDGVWEIVSEKSSVKLMQ